MNALLSHHIVVQFWYLPTLLSALTPSLRHVPTAAPTWLHGVSPASINQSVHIHAVCSICMCAGSLNVLLIGGNVLVATIAGVTLVRCGGGLAGQCMDDWGMSAIRTPHLLTRR